MAIPCLFTDKTLSHLERNTNRIIHSFSFMVASNGKPGTSVRSIDCLQEYKPALDTTPTARISLTQIVLIFLILDTVFRENPDIVFQYGGRHILYKKCLQKISCKLTSRKDFTVPGRTHHKLLGDCQGNHFSMFYCEL